jgi:prepilin-type N-terminal cleavage/methylation domain-containing protein
VVPGHDPDGDVMTRLCGDDDGFTLVEVIIAMVVFAAGLLSLLAAFSSSLDTSFDNRARLVAANLAASDIDDARAADYGALATKSYTKVVDGRSYAVYRSVAPTLITGGVSPCVSGSAQEVNKRVSTRVEFTFREGVKPVRSDTVISAPVFDPTSTNGAIGAHAIDRDGQPVEGATVVIGATTGYTDESGCAFFDGLAPGNYSVSVSKSGGYVGQDGASPTTQTLGVTAGQVGKQDFAIDRAAVVTVTSAVLGASGAVLSGYAVPTGLQAHLDTPDRATTTKTALPTKGVALGSPLVWNAFPTVAGYDTYLGICSTVVHTATDRGATPSVGLPLVPVDVQLTGTSPKVRNRQLNASWSGACGSATETLSFLPSTNTTGAAKIALPPGTWALSAVGTTGSTTVTAIPMVPLTATWPVS